MLGAWLFGFCCAWVAIGVAIAPPGAEDLTTAADFFDYLTGAVWGPIRIVAASS